MTTSPDNALAGRLSHPPDDALWLVERAPSADAILEVCLKITGMGYGVVAHVTEERWLACAVRDQVGFGLPVGGELPVLSTLCHEVCMNNTPIAFDHASADPKWRDHSTPRTYNLESYIAVPITLADGEMFGTLCAIDPALAPASRPETVQMFQLFAQLIATQIDATRRIRQSEEALVAAQETAVFRDQFIAVLGHDLRNPLAAVDAGVQLMRRRAAGTEVERFIPGILEATGRMARLIDDVLDFARGRLGEGLTASRSPTDLRPVLAQVVTELLTGRQDRVIETDISLPAPVFCDADRIAQLASNLLGNALVHGDPAVPVRLRSTIDGNVFTLAVRNGGAAISPEIRARLFQPFSRGNRGEKSEGLGLGLYIASQIAAAHDGDMSVSSIQGETCFEFRMPVGGVPSIT